MHNQHKGQVRAPLEHQPSNNLTDVILRNCILAGIFLLPFVCLIVSSSFFFPFITGKNFTFRIIVEIIFALWLILALRDRSALPKSSKLLWTFAIFLGVIFISDLLSPNSFKSFWSNYERMEGWVTLAHLFALFLVASSVMTKKLWEWLFRVSIGVSLILFVIGSFQLIGSSEWFSANAPDTYKYFHENYPIHQGSSRIDATIGNSSYLGGYMLLHAFLALYLLFVYIRKNYGTRDWNVFWPTFYIVAFMAEVFMLFKTATRGAEIGFLAGMVCFSAVVAFFERENKILRRTCSGILIVIVLLIGLFVIERKSDFVVKQESLSRLGSFVDQLLSFDKKVICEGELKSRCLLWPVAFQGVKERPVFGWGQESFNYVFNKYYDPRLYSQEQWFDRTHNVILDWLISGGILGLISYLSLFGFALYYVWRKGGPFSFAEKGIISGFIVGYFFYELTVFDNITSYILFIFVLAYIHGSSGVVSERLAAKLAAVDSGTKNRVLVPLIGVAAVFVLYTVNVPTMLAASELIQALSGHQGGASVNLTHFEKVFSYRTLGDSEAREQLIQKAAQAADVAGLDPKIKTDFFNLARKEILLQLERTPEDARYHLFAGSLFASFGDSDNAIKYLLKAHELSPKKQTIMFSLGSAYLGKGDFASGAAVLKQAFELDTSFAEAGRYYALVLIYAKQKDVALEVLKPLPPDAVFADQRLLQAYFTNGYFDEALRSIDFLIGKEPSNAQLYFSRAVVKYKLGKPNQAIADLNKVLELNPVLKPQVDEFISKIRLGQPI